MTPYVCSYACRAGLTAKKDPSSRTQLAQVLSVAVRAVSLLGLLAVTFGPWYSYVLLRVVYSQRWADTEAPVVLGYYTAYLLLLAVNGEAQEHRLTCASMLAIGTDSQWCVEYVRTSMQPGALAGKSLHQRFCFHSLAPALH